MFRVGDRVKIIRCLLRDPAHEGKTGTIICLLEMSRYRVKLDKPTRYDDSCDSTKVELLEKRKIEEFGIVKWMRENAKV